MSSPTNPSRRERRAPKPLDQGALQELALVYVGRFATSAAKLETYLKRKLRERGWEGQSAPDPQALAARFVDLGYVDDEALAWARTSGLLRRGYGPRRVTAALREAGIPEHAREAVAVGDKSARQAALVMARKRRFGPFGQETVDRARREKQIVAMLRAGHDMGHARALIDAESQERAEEWAEEDE